MSDFWGLMGCNLIVFVTSICIMVLELTASRLIAKHIGSSLYTWTSVIGVVLTGITIGNYLGGWMADRFEHRKSLAWLFFIASVLCFSVLWMDQIVHGIERPDRFSWPTWVLCVVAAVYLLPSIAMGTISPIVASMALARNSRTGITVGNVYAWGALGSIIGTFLTGFILIGLFGTKAIVLMVAATLAAMGVFSAAGQRVFRTAVCAGWLQFVCLTGLAAAANAESLGAAGALVGKALSIWPASTNAENSGDDGSSHTAKVIEWTRFGEQLGENFHALGLTLRLREDDPDEYHDESNYSYINVKPGVEDGDDVKYLRLDKLIHSYYNPSKPTELYYEYERIYAAVTERALTDRRQVTSVSLGAFPNREAIVAILPNWIHYDAERQRLELDRALTEEQLAALLELSPAGSWWQAVDDLHRATSRPDWGGFSSTHLEAIPDGVAIPESLSETVLFDSNLQLLNSYTVVDDEVRNRLLGLGIAGTDLPYYRAVRELYGKSRRVSTMFIGGGGFIFPRWIEAKFPYRPRIDVAELDPAVKLAVQEEMGLPADGETAVTTYIGDARNFVDDRLRENARLKLRGEPPVLYDFVYGDAFNDFSVPWHLTTREFSEKVKSLLNEQGVYLVNVIDIYPLTEYPEIHSDDEGSYLPYPGILPEKLLAQSTTYLEWESCPPPFDAVEVIQVEEGGDYRLGVRGVMPDGLRDKLLALAPNDNRFAEAVHDLYQRSRLKRTGRFLGSFVNTITQVFPNVYVFSSTEGSRPSDTRDTLIIVASLAPIDMTELGDAGGYWHSGPFAWQETAEETTYHGQMEALLLTARDMVLEDDFAPVDNLLRPVFEDQE